jgi:RNA polymerase sigma factor (sigma-70 family)
MMGSAAGTVFLIDDDASVRRSLARALLLEGFNVQAWESALAFLSEHDPFAPGCLVLDVAMPGMTGIELQRLLGGSGSSRPIVFITGKGDIATSVAAMRAGAVTYLAKPVRIADLAAAVREALQRDTEERQSRERCAQIRAWLAALTARERQVLDLVLAGKLNKQIGAELGVAEKTVKVHRGRVMRKMHARSVAELARLTLAANRVEHSRPEEQLRT